MGDLFDRLGDHINTVGQPVYEKRCFLRGLGDLFDRLGDHIKTGWATCLWEEMFFKRVGRLDSWEDIFFIGQDTSKSVLISLTLLEFVCWRTIHFYPIGDAFPIDIIKVALILHICIAHFLKGGFYVLYCQRCIFHAY